MPGNIEPVMIDDITAEVNRTVGVPRNIIRDMAENAAETFVATRAKLDPDSLTYQVEKDKYIDAFIDKMKWAI